MASSTSNGPVPQPRRSFKQVLLSYFYWTYERGTVHYDVMVTLILLFIFVTPHLWDYGAKPTLVAGSSHPFQVVASGRGVMVTVQASDVDVQPGASYQEVKHALRKAVEPVTGDDVFVERWDALYDSQGKLTAWRVWAHR
jgi:hypothetical protein